VCHATGRDFRSVVCAKLHGFAGQDVFGADGERETSFHLDSNGNATFAKFVRPLKNGVIIKVVSYNLFGTLKDKGRKE